MCTLTLAWQVFEDAPVVVAANRDERFDRPSSGPSVRGSDPAILSPRDERAGGTWIGVNEYGVFAGVTNRWVDADLAGGRSRGLLVGDALARRTAEDAARAVERSADENEYEGFNLVVADANAAILLEWDGQMRVTQWDPGVHVVVNVGADGAYRIPAVRQDVAERQAESADRLREAMQPEPGESAEEWRDHARSLLGDHDYEACVHGDGFGTRSSSLVEVAVDGRVEYEWADGPPCTTAYESVFDSYVVGRTGDGTNGP